MSCSVDTELTPKQQPPSVDYTDEGYTPRALPDPSKKGGLLPPVLPPNNAVAPGDANNQPLQDSSPKRRRKKKKRHSKEPAEESLQPSESTEGD